MCCTTASIRPRLRPSWVTNSCPTMISACCSTPRNCGSSSATVGLAISSRLTASVAAAAYGSPERLERPPSRDEQHRHHAAGDVHGEHPEQREHRKRDAVAVPQCGHDQHHGRHGEAVGDEVGHRGGVELDVGDRGERRRQRARRGRRTSGAPFVGSATQQLPCQRRAARRGTARSPPPVSSACTRWSALPR